MLYSKQTGGLYSRAIHGAAVPPDAVEISPAVYDAVFANPAPGKVLSHTAEGMPILVDPPAPLTSASVLCAAIDEAADAARSKVAGDPLRAVEYDRARIEAEAFAAADYQGEVPRTVAAWAINGRTPRQAAESILAEAAAYTEALYLLRETRLQAKELVRTQMALGNAEAARDIAAEAIALIEAAVSGVGNATT